jgi:hypothetical protein
MPALPLARGRAVALIVAVVKLSGIESGRIERGTF